MPTEIRLSLPYPSIEGIGEDYRSAAIISPAYAGMHGELTAILQYVYHSFYFEKAGMAETADIMIGIAICEMKHLDILGSLILELGIQPIFTALPPRRCNFYNTAAVSYSQTPQKMLMDDITGELTPIEEYTQMLGQLSDERVGAVISRIRLDEELHVKVLQEQLEKLTGSR